MQEQVTAPVIVRQEGEAPDDWRRFVAVLCFIEFYTRFVWNGRWLWDLVTNDWYYHSLEERYHLHVGCAVLYTVRACAFWGLGRSLWRNYRTTQSWLAVVVLCSVGIVIATLLNTRDSHAISFWFGLRIETETYPALANLVAALTDCAECLLWAALLVCGWSVTRRRRNRRAAKRPSWVVFAAAWSLSMAAVHFLRPQFSYWMNLADVLVMLAQQHAGSIYASIPVLYVVLPLLAGGWLLLTRKASYLLPLLIALLGIASLGSWIWLWLPRVVTADGSYRLAFNQGLFDVLFVGWIANVGPWLLIAAYAWRLPTRMPVDDGSPYPRRYCGRCRYNLHGITSSTCPECGALLQAHNE